MEQQSNSDISKVSLIDGKKVQPRQVVDTPLHHPDDIAATLPSLLQTTLLLEELLPMFEQQLRLVLTFDSFQYAHAHVDCHIDIGSPRHHRCHYKLEMNGEYLGDLTLTRRYEFTEQQLEMLESLLCQVVYPLRNSLLYKQALRSALQDDLTGLGNRAAYENSLSREVELAKRQGSPLSLVVIDIDNFKAINDAFGHQSGDRALKTLAKTTLESMRRYDLAFRFGGEEFVLLLSNTDMNAARIVAERLRTAVADTLCHDGKNCFGFTVSLGIAELQADEQGYHLFERADIALYQAKQTGRNQTVCAP